MYQQRRTAPAVSAYESQAARWKQGFATAGQPGSGGGGDLEGALVAELCSSVGSSSFPPRDVLQKLLRHLPALDHVYVCELLDDKLQHALWQVQGKALSVLDAVLKTVDADAFKRHYHAHAALLQALAASRKDIVRNRAEKVLAVINAFVPPPQEVAPPPPAVIEQQQHQQAPVVSTEAAAPHDPIHDAFEGLDSSTDSGLDSLDNTHVSLETPYPPVEPQVLTSEPLREVILDIELPPGPMGLVLDRTIANMAVIERFIPLPTGGKGYLEMHPAICPGCALISINSVNVENKGLEEVGPVLAAFAQMPKVLRFKKLMNNGRTANPSTLLMPYIPPPPEEDEAAKKASEEHMERLTEFSESLDEIESKLEDLIRREQLGLPVVDRKNQLAQLHGNVEKIQTQGIDAVILGPNPPPNFDEVKKFRSSLVRRADGLTKRIQRTAEEVPAPPSAPADVDAAAGSPVSAFGFVSGETATTAAPPASEGSSSFHFLNPSTPPVQTTAATSGFSFMEAQSEEPPTSSFAFLQNAPSPAPVATSAPANPPLNSVFAGLSVREEPASINARSAGPLTMSALGESMASTMSSVSTLYASALPGFAPPPTPASSFNNPDAASSSAFGFMSTSISSEYTDAAPTVSSPTAFGFLRSSANSSTSSSSESEAAAPAAGPASSAFAFISS